MGVSGGKPPSGDQRNSAGWCEVHEKVRYTSRKAARRTARRCFPGEPMHAYPCEGGDVPNLWHFGHLHVSIRRGWAGREDFHPKPG